MGAALGSELRALDGGHCRGVVRAQGAGRQLYRRRTASRQAACANSAYIAECALAPGSCRQRTGFALPAPSLGRGEAEGLLERDRKSVVQGKGVSVRLDTGGRRSIKTKHQVSK